MTNEEAIHMMEMMMPLPRRGDGKSTTHLLQTLAISMAIEALQERKTGKWIWREDEKYYDTPTGNATYECSLCHHSDVHAKTQEVPFCWWCGAKMEVDE